MHTKRLKIVMHASCLLFPRRRLTWNRSWLVLKWFKTHIKYDWYGFLIILSNFRLWTLIKFNVYHFLLCLSVLASRWISYCFWTRSSVSAIDLNCPKLNSLLFLRQIFAHFFVIFLAECENMYINTISMI